MRKRVASEKVLVRRTRNTVHTKHHAEPSRLQPLAVHSQALRGAFEAR